MRVARGWRWGRPPPLPRDAEVDPIRTDAAFPTDWAREPWARVTRGLIQELVMLPALRTFAKPRVIGRERLANLEPPVVIAANHASHFDTAILVDAVPASWRDKLAVGAAADYFFTSNPRGWAAALAIGAFPVERKRASTVSARLAVRLLREGWNLILFPEGGRSQDGWLQELKPGAAYAAAKAGCPIVPVWLVGTEHLLPKGAKRPQPGRVEVFIGDPLRPAPGENPRVLHERLAESMYRLGEEATTDWWTALRTPSGELHGPEAARWRRVWARGGPLPKARSRWR